MSFVRSAKCEIITEHAQLSDLTIGETVIEMLD